GRTGNHGDQDTKSHDGDTLHHGDERFTQNLAKDDRIARDGRDEYLLAEVVVAVFDERDDAKRRRLKQGLRINAGKGVQREVIADGVPHTALEAGPQHGDKHKWEDKG